MYNENTRTTHGYYRNTKYEIRQVTNRIKWKCKTPKILYNAMAVRPPVPRPQQRPGMLGKGGARGRPAIRHTHTGNKEGREGRLEEDNLVIK